MNPVIVTDNACKAFLDNLKSDNSENKYIRIAIRGGGCSGLQYILDMVEAPDTDDTTWEQDGVKFVLDDYSRPYLEGMTIDYGSGLNSSGFQFINPKASRSCGCGSSFSV
jgi:iron-sulfur cluster assembly protein